MQGSDKNKVALIIGGILVLLGIWQLAEHFFGNFLEGLWRFIGVAAGILGSLIVIALGLFLVIASRKDKLSLPKDRKLYRSTRSRKIAGVCGGIAEYLNADYAAVRIITLMLAVLCWYIVIPLYIVLWVILPPNTPRFNSWM
ncbi:MAG: PspC domain-containing protein [Coriobacteriales bacterium]|jgi:phage shock protein PspC (stress-responsive transcriptional regulator)|nr:PspC domain-containing protein [Coriobacteriales bacterium]